MFIILSSFGTIRNNTALKLHSNGYSYDPCFGTIRNNTALKLDGLDRAENLGFGTIRNNTALKHTNRIR